MPRFFGVRGWLDLDPTLEPVAGEAGGPAIYRPKAGSILEGKIEVQVQLSLEGHPIVMTRIP